jgi:hypothetical protein
MAQRDTAHGAAVLAGSDRISRGLLIGSFVHDQRRVPVIEVTGRSCRSDVLPLQGLVYPSG